MKHAVVIEILSGFNVLLFHATQEASLLVTLGPSYVVMRFVMGKAFAAGALLLAHIPMHGA